MDCKKGLPDLDSFGLYNETRGYNASQGSMTRNPVYENVEIFVGAFGDSSVTVAPFLSPGTRAKVFCRRIVKGPARPRYHLTLLPQGIFSTQVQDEKTKAWRDANEVQVHVTVEVLSKSHQEVVNTLQRAVDKKAANKGSFNFVASDYGEHVICVSTSAQEGWFSTASVVRFSFSHA